MSFVAPILKYLHLNSLHLFLSLLYFSLCFLDVKEVMLGRLLELLVEGTRGNGLRSAHCFLVHPHAEIVALLFTGEGSSFHEVGHQLVHLRKSVLLLLLHSLDELLVVFRYGLQNLRVFGEQNLFEVSVGVLHSSSRHADDAPENHLFLGKNLQLFDAFLEVCTRDVVVPYSDHGQFDLGWKSYLEGEVVGLELEDRVVFFTLGVRLVRG